MCIRDSLVVVRPYNLLSESFFLLHHVRVLVQLAFDSHDYAAVGLDCHWILTTTVMPCPIWTLRSIADAPESVTLKLTLYLQLQDSESIAIGIADHCLKGCSFKRILQQQVLVLELQLKPVTSITPISSVATWACKYILRDVMVFYLPSCMG